MSTPPFKVKAVYDYTSPHEDDLHFSVSQIITVTEAEDDDWYTGEYVDHEGSKREGIFPRNFVERYEPTAPPRPTRAPKPKKETETSTVDGGQHDEQPEPEPPVKSPRHDNLEEERSLPAMSPEQYRAPTPAIQAAMAPKPPVQPTDEDRPAAAEPVKATPKPSASTPVDEKPTGGSFRDRIAAFNKAAPPVAPFKPGGLGSGGANTFIKKPFVAPPPSKNAYVPPVTREAPVQRVYKREEDPEIIARQSADLEQAERAGLTSSHEHEDEEQRKPTSLKERIALLQKQQMEQAARHAEAAAKKEKPKKPAKKMSRDVLDASHETDEGLARRSTDLTRDDDGLNRRRSIKSPAFTEAQARKSLGDGNEADMSGAGDTTEDPEELTGNEGSVEAARHEAAPVVQPDVGEEEGAVEEPKDADAAESEEDEEDDEDVDPEVRRKEELRARMAKMSGGMGMHGMFGGGMPMPVMPPKKKKSSGVGDRQAVDEDATSGMSRAPTMPMVPMPGMSHVRSPEENDPTPITSAHPADEVADVEDVVPQEEQAQAALSSRTVSGAPPIPGGRPAPPPIPKDTRPHIPTSPPLGVQNEDDTSLPERQHISVPLHRGQGDDEPASPKLRSPRQSMEEAVPSSPDTPVASKRTSRVPPLPPSALPASTGQSRPPPPLPPSGPPTRAPTNDPRGPPSRHSMAGASDDGETTAYEGDYDTDMAPMEHHKDALKASEGAQVKSPIMHTPSTPARAAPPPPPTQPPHRKQSSDLPRAAPPPPPPQTSAAKVPAPWETGDDEYDPYRYVPPIAPPSRAPPRQPVPQHSLPVPVAPSHDSDDEDLYSASPPRASTMPMEDIAMTLPPQREVAAPPPPPAREPTTAAPPPAAPAAAAPTRAAPRQSLDVHRSATTSGRRSSEHGRMSMDSGFVANDIDLGHSSQWWTKTNGVPPALYNRRDVLFESDEARKREGSQTVISKDLFVLFTDYSQTIITAHFDAQNPADVRLEQRHEPPPARLRQDQLEQAHEQFSLRIAEAVTAKKETVVGDGTPQGLIAELLRPLPNALLPVGTRAYGALVYANLANASTLQNDEIRPGDILALRNAKFQGKHGAMHAKYSVEVGKPDHVGVVAEWDGTKKKVRAWEQGRESKKVRLESFKLDDLRSGEVKIWRVMPRSWVGWEGKK